MTRCFDRSAIKIDLVIANGFIDLKDVTICAVVDEGMDAAFFVSLTVPKCIGQGDLRFVALSLRKILEVPNV